jgi:flagellar biogenesis protein FliO
MLRRQEIEEGEARRTNASLGLIVILLLAIAGVWLVRELRKESQIEDCLMQGRRNCVPVEVPAHDLN